MFVALLGERLSSFLIASYGPYVHDKGEGRQCYYLWQYAGSVASADKHRAHTVNEPPAMVDEGQRLCPVGHGGHGGEESGEKDEADNDEPHHEDSLLKCVVAVGHDKSQTADGEDEEHGEKIHQQQVALAGDAVDKPRQQEAHCHHTQAYHPVGDEFGEDKHALADGCDIDLVDGTRLFFTHDIHCGQEATEEDDEDSHQGRYHIYFVVQILVVEIERGKGGIPGG